MADTLNPSTAQPVQPVQPGFEMPVIKTEAENNDSVPASIAIKQEELPTETDTVLVKDTDSALANIDTKKFVWDDWTEDAHKRVAIKQHEVEAGLQHASEILQLLGSHGVDKDPKEKFGAELIQWMEEIDQLRTVHKLFQILVGVTGRTGAGKSTILNMLLGYPELLPSSNSEASTSCACRVAWNDDDTPGHEFRAEVVFRSREDLMKELEELFARLRERALERDDENIDDLIEKMDLATERESMIQESLKKVKAVWKLAEAVVESMTAEQLLNSNPEVLQLLGTTKVIYSGNAERFAEEVKPYMDSSEHDQGFRSWPLITEVRLFVKAPILKRGVVLVDLPGLSDSVESRAEVANKFRQSLDLIIIVTPARRAIDEKTGVQLMSEYQAHGMQLEGKFNKRFFCVAVSQVDEIDCPIFLKDARSKKDPEILSRTQRISELTQLVADLKNKLKEARKEWNRKKKILRTCDRQVTKLQGGRRSVRKDLNEGRKKKLAEAKDAKTKASRNCSTSKTTVGKLETELADAEKQLAEARGRLKWTCVWKRNDHIRTAITEDFAQRQKSMVQKISVGKDGKDFNGKDYDGSVDVIPVSATAFRDHLNGEPVEGFPTQRHTGIPQLRQWLADAALERRELHLDTTLKALCRLLMTLRQSLMTSAGQVIDFPRDNVEAQISEATQNFLKTLEKELQTAAEAIQTLDPFKDIRSGEAASVKAACIAAVRWAYMFPGNKASRVMMHWATFDAILRKIGGPHRSKSKNGEDDIEYDFPASMASQLLEGCLREWIKTFELKIPNTLDPIKAHIKQIWDTYIKDLKARLGGVVSDILPHLENNLHLLFAVKDEIELKIKAVLQSLSDSAAQIHPEFLASLRHDLAPMFLGALEINGDKQYERRRAFLVEEVKKNSQGFLAAGCEKMKAKYTENINKLPRKFREIAQFAASKITTHLMLLLDQLQGVSAEAWAIKDMTQQLETLLKQAVINWGTEWMFPNIEPEEMVRKDDSVPKEYGGTEAPLPVKRRGNTEPRAKAPAKGRGKAPAAAKTTAKQTAAAVGKKTVRQAAKAAPKAAAKPAPKSKGKGKAKAKSKEFVESESEDESVADEPMVDEPMADEPVADEDSDDSTEEDSGSDSGSETEFVEGESDDDDDAMDVDD